MSVKAILDRVQPFTNGWSRTRLLHEIEQLQDEMVDDNISKMIYIGTDNNGFPPFLQTTSGTFRYSVIPGNFPNVSDFAITLGGTARSVRAKRVTRVFVDTSANDYNNRWAGEPYIYYFPNPYSTETSRLSVANVPITAYQALEDDAAYFDFKEDPGTSTGMYFVEFEWEAPRLTSESIPLIVPLKYEKTIENGLMGRVQAFQNGRVQNDWTAKYEQGVMAFRQEMTMGADSNNMETLARDF